MRDEDFLQLLVDIPYLDTQRYHRYHMMHHLFFLGESLLNNLLIYPLTFRARVQDIRENLKRVIVPMVLIHCSHHQIRMLEELDHLPHEWMDSFD